MIQIAFFQQNNVFMGFCSQGHAGYADEGWDVVCAAVSALTQTTLAALLEQLPRKDSVLWKMDKGFLEVRLEESFSRDEQKNAQILLKALLTGLKMIQEQYPEYVSVVIKGNGR